MASLTSFVIARLFHPHSIYERQMGMELASEGRMLKRLNRHRRPFTPPPLPKGVEGEPS